VEGDTLPSGAAIAPGSKIFLSPWVVQRQARYFADPLRFDPERNGGADRPAFAYFPFGGGRRVCIGQALARLECTLAIASIARVRRLHRLNDDEVGPFPGITLRPASPVVTRVAD
jgi:cytochrome P450